MSDAVTVRPVITDLALCADEIPILTADAALPCWESRRSRRFDRYYRACAEAFTQYCRCGLFPQAEAAYRQALETAAPLPQWHARLTAAITCQTDALVSLYADTAVTGGAVRSVTRRADTWDLRRGLPLSLQDFFPHRTPWRHMLLQAAAQQIEAEESQGISAYHADWRRMLRRRFHSHRFYLTDGGLCFFYPMYAIAPAAEGLPTFQLPYDSEKGPFPPEHFAAK